MTGIIEFILNYVFVPIFIVIWGIWKLLANLITDVTRHIYGKIIVPVLALLIVAYLAQFFAK